MLANVRMCREIYPGWEVVVFHDDSLSPGVLPLLFSAGATTVRVPAGYCPRRATRFLAAGLSKIERVIFRDADSRPSAREAEAVGRWIESGLPFHAMKDHPCHKAPLLAGMWGCIGGSLPEVRRMLRRFPWRGADNDDQMFLEALVWEAHRDRFLIHDSRVEESRDEESVGFPVAAVPGEFVGRRVAIDAPVQN